MCIGVPELKSKMTLSRPHPMTPPYPENTVLVQGPHPQKMCWRATKSNCRVYELLFYSVWVGFFSFTEI